MLVAEQLFSGLYSLALAFLSIHLCFGDVSFVSTLTVVLSYANCRRFAPARYYGPSFERCFSCISWLLPNIHFLLDSHEDNASLDVPAFSWFGYATAHLSWSERLNWLGRQSRNTTAVVTQVPWRNFGHWITVITVCLCQRFLYEGWKDDMAKPIDESKSKEANRHTSNMRKPDVYWGVHPLWNFMCKSRFFARLFEFAIIHVLLFSWETFEVCGAFQRWSQDFRSFSHEVIFNYVKLSRERFVREKKCFLFVNVRDNWRTEVVIYKLKNSYLRNVNENTESVALYTYRYSIQPSHPVFGLCRVNFM